MNGTPTTAGCGKKTKQNKNKRGTLVEVEGILLLLIVNSVSFATSSPEIFFGVVGDTAEEPEIYKYKQNKKEEGKKTKCLK